MRKHENTIRLVISIIEDIQFDDHHVDGFFEERKILSVVRRFKKTRSEAVLAYHVANRLVHTYLNKTRGMSWMNQRKLRNAIELQKHINSIIEALDRLGYISVIDGAKNEQWNSNCSTGCVVKTYI